MTFVDWLADTRRNVRQQGLEGLREAGYEFYLGLWRRFGRLYNYGEPIYEQDWDVLIVLDACRADLMEEVASEYEFVSTEATTSVASTSAEWMEKNFRSADYQDEVRQTAYVTGNPFTDEVFFDQQCPECGAARSRVPGKQCAACSSSAPPERVPNHSFECLEEVWRYHWDDDYGTILPGPLTDRAIEVWREGSSRRMIVHYMQPHHPFVTSSIETSLSPDGFGEMGRESVWDQLRAGRVDRDRVWNDYRENLTVVLESVGKMLRNIDTDSVVITSDHGNAVGEWGLYGHHRGVPLPQMKRVPWCKTSARDVEGLEPDTTQESEDEGDVEKRLEDLGYL